LASALYQPSRGMKITEKQYNILETQSVSVLKQKGSEATTQSAYASAVFYTWTANTQHSVTCFPASFVCVLQI
jgi:hypothetical protein